MNLDEIEARWPEGRLANSDARAGVSMLIARVRELEERLEQRTRERDHERAIVANGCFTPVKRHW